MKPTAIGAYCFAGGFTVGMSKHFKVLAHLEDGTYGVKSTLLNFPKLPVFTDFATWPTDDLRRERPAVVYGNPPCAAWSSLNGKKVVTAQTWAQDPRVDCTRKHFTLLETLQPKVWVWESVERAWLAGRAFIDELTERALALGYSVDHVLIDGSNVGLNHRRRRYFFVATKVAVDWAYRYIEPLTADQALKATPARLADDSPNLPLPKTWLPLYKKQRPRQTLRRVFELDNPNPKTRQSSTGKTIVVGKPAFCRKRLMKGELCHTLIGSMTLHYSKPRYLSMAEMRALCGYPANYRLEAGGDSGDRWNLFTRAVMPPVADWLGKRLAKAVKTGKRTRGRVCVVNMLTKDYKEEVLR